MGQGNAKTRIQQTDIVIKHDQREDDGNGRQKALQQDGVEHCQDDGIDQYLP